MKRILIIVIICLFLLVGCGKDKSMTLECDMPVTTVTITVDGGKIIKYIDKKSGELSSNEIDLLNESYLNGVYTNKEAIIKLREVIAGNGGDCKY